MDKTQTLEELLKDWCRGAMPALDLSRPSPFLKLIPKADPLISLGTLEELGEKIKRAGETEATHG